VIKNLLYVIGIFVAVAWYWDSKYALLSGQNPAGARGKWTTGLLPFLLLVFVSRRFYCSLREGGVVAPYKIIFGIIYGSLALCFIPAAFNPSAFHRTGALECLLLCGIVATILLALAYRAQHRSHF
jgi:hypothetical protein